MAVCGFRQAVEPRERIGDVAVFAPEIVLKLALRVRESLFRLADPIFFFFGAPLGLIALAALDKKHCGFE